MEIKTVQRYTLDDRGMVTFPIPQIDGDIDIEIDSEKLRKSDEKNNALREAIRKTGKTQEGLEQM